MRIIFLGTPAFAVPSLRILLENGYDVVAVVTAPDKPAGRGMKMHQSEVKQFAVQHELMVLQPEKLKDQTFLDTVRSLHANLQVVVAFRMMPEELWSMPPLGTFNLHASLLPQYRGAAPIQRAVMNGETKTGVTTFFLQKEIDTGKIIYRKEVAIGDNETAGSLHDRLMEEGASLVLKTVKAVEKGSYETNDQSAFIMPGELLKTAPKIFRDDCRLDFSRPVKTLFNQVRGLSPHPAAFFGIRTGDGEMAVKIFSASYEECPVVLTHHCLTDGKSYLKISAADGLLEIKELQWPGKKRMMTAEFLRGFHLEDQWQII